VPKQKKQKRETDPATVLRFTDDHLWVRAEAERAQVGISDQGQDSIGEIIAVELPDVGDSIERGPRRARVAGLHVDRTSVSGTVRAVNGDLEDHPRCQRGPVSRGWLIETIWPTKTS
jgi:glycine cleavage system H protein